MLLYEIQSLGTAGEEYFEEVQTDFPLEFLGLSVWTVIPKDEVFPMRRIVGISVDDTFPRRLPL